MTAPRGGERGAVSIIVIAVLLVGVAVAIAAARAGVVLIGQARAETAADAAALAAADTLALGRRGPEAAARDAALRNGARLVSCDCGGTHAEVVVEIRLRGATASKVRGRARAEVRPACAALGGCGASVSAR